MQNSKLPGVSRLGVNSMCKPMIYGQGLTSVHWVMGCSLPYPKLTPFSGEQSPCQDNSHCINLALSAKAFKDSILSRWFSNAGVLSACSFQ